MEGACASCLRRSWLLAQLSATLDYSAGQEERLLALLELPDEKLIAALGGRRAAQLKQAYRAPGAGTAALAPQTDVICLHDKRYPRRLHGHPGAARTLHVMGGLEQLESLAARPAVAIVGTRRATDYGMAIARELARSLTRCGVAIACSFADGIARAACAGIVEARDAALIVLAGGVDECRPASQRTLRDALVRSGCLLSELPCGLPARRWCEPARERTIAGLCELMVVVEAGPSESELRVARMARRLGRPVGALPGRVTSSASQGTNELLARGAHLIRGAADVLELLALGRPQDLGAQLEPLESSERLDGHLREVLDRIVDGQDTLGRLTADGRDPAGIMAALGELELLGRVQRGDAGRYIPNL